MAKKTYFNWSSGKDSAMALQALLSDKEYDVTYLLTSVNDTSGHVTMHGLREEMLLKQFEAIGIPHGVIRLPDNPSNDDYQRIMGEKVSWLKNQGYDAAAFGDIFLEDLKAYREQQLQPYGIAPVFPLWKRDTRSLMQNFVTNGFKAVVICVDASKLDASYLGKVVDEAFLDSLPENVDACGENGEFHTFCFDAPFFSHPISYLTGKTRYSEFGGESHKNGFRYCDLTLTGK